MTHINQLFFSGHHSIIKEKIFTICKRLNSDSQRWARPNPRSSEHTTSSDQTDFTQAINQRTLKWEDFPGSDQWVQCHHRDLVGGVRQKVTAGVGESMTGTEVGVTQGRDHCQGLWAAPGSWRMQEAPWSPQKEHRSGGTLISCHLWLPALEGGNSVKSLSLW